MVVNLDDFVIVLICSWQITVLIYHKKVKAILIFKYKSVLIITVQKHDMLKLNI